MGDTSNSSTSSSTTTVPTASVDTSFKIHITPFNGIPSNLDAFLDDLKYLWSTKGWTAPRDKQIMAASIFMNCSDTVKVNLRLLSATDRHDQEVLINHLKATYGIQDKELVTRNLEQLTSIQQGHDESLRDYITRAKMILNKLTQHQSALNLTTIGNGELALYYVRKGIRNKMYRELLMLGADSWADSPDFLTAVTRLFQTDSNSFNASINFKSGLPYDYRSKQREFKP